VFAGQGLGHTPPTDPDPGASFAGGWHAGTVLLREAGRPANSSFTGGLKTSLEPSSPELLRSPQYLYLDGRAWTEAGPDAAGPLAPGVGYIFSVSHCPWQHHSPIRAWADLTIKSAIGLPAHSSLCSALWRSPGQGRISARSAVQGDWSRRSLRPGASCDSGERKPRSTIPLPNEERDFQHRVPHGSHGEQKQDQVPASLHVRSLSIICCDWPNRNHTTSGRISSSPPRMVRRPSS